MRGKLLTAAVLLLCVLVAPGQKPSKEQLEQKNKAARAKAAQLRQEIRKTNREISYIQSDIRKADALMSQTRARIAETQRRLRDAKSKQFELGKELAEATAELEASRINFAERLRAVHLRGEKNALYALLNAESFTQAAQMNHVMSRVAEYDRDLLGRLKEMRKLVEQRKSEVDAVVMQIDALNQRQLNQKRDLDRHMATKRGFLQERNQERSQTQQELNALERESRQVEAELRRYYGTPSNVPVWRGNFMQPISGRITSGFGNRRHPVLGGTRMHTGVDIAAPTGTSIKAAADGRVIYSGYRGGYGNTIIIDHGGGVATLYAHASRLHVSVGKDVKQGDVIAAVGSTGMSTGPHLHWEIRINGTPVNPMSR